jgi:hypothetical protein
MWQFGTAFWLVWPDSSPQYMSAPIRGVDGLSMS